MLPDRYPRSTKRQLSIALRLGARKLLFIPGSVTRLGLGFSRLYNCTMMRVEVAKRVQSAQAFPSAPTSNSKTCHLRTNGGSRGRWTPTAALEINLAHCTTFIQQQQESGLGQTVVGTLHTLGEKRYQMPRNMPLTGATLSTFRVRSQRAKYICIPLARHTPAPWFALLSSEY